MPPIILKETNSLGWWDGRGEGGQLGIKGNVM